MVVVSAVAGCSCAALLTAIWAASGGPTGNTLNYLWDGPTAWVLHSGRENVSRAALLFRGDIPAEMLSAQHEVHELTGPLTAAPC